MVAGMLDDLIGDNRRQISSHEQALLSREERSEAILKRPMLGATFCYPTVDLIYEFFNNARDARNNAIMLAPMAIIQRVRLLSLRVLFFFSVWDCLLFCW